MKKALHFIFCLCLFCGTLLAQSSKKDSLEQVVKSGKGNDRVDALNRLIKIIYKADLVRAKKLLAEAEAGSTAYPKGKVRALANKARIVFFEEKSVDKAIAFYREALDLANKTNDADGQESVSIGLASMLRDKGDLEGCRDVIAKGIAVAERTKNISFKSGMLSSSGTLQYYIGNFDSALYFYNQAMAGFERLGKKGDIAGIAMNTGIMLYRNGKARESVPYYLKATRLFEETKDSVNYANALINVGITESYLGIMDTAIAYFSRAEKIMRAVKDQLGIASCLDNVAACHDAQGKSDVALKLYLEAMKIKERENDLRGMSFSYTSIADAYEQIGDTAKKFDYLFKAKDVALKMGDQIRYARTLVSLGGGYYMARKFPESKKYLDEALEVETKLNDRPGIGNVMLSLGNYYKLQNDLVNSLRYYKESLKIKEELEDKVGAAGLLNNIGVIYYDEKKYKEALNYYERAFAIRKEINNPKGISDSYWSLANVYGMLKDYQKAYKYEVLYHQAWDSLNNAGIRDQIAEMNTKYESAKKDKEIMQRKVSEKEANSRAEKETLERQSAEGRLYFAVIGITLLLILAGFVIYGNIQRKKANRLLEERNIEIIRQRNEVETQKLIVEEKQKEILDSIHYAKRIQHALMASEKYVERSLKKLAGGD
jgi:tetratricopeptide (TPR) repeat protein